MRQPLNDFVDEAKSVVDIARGHDIQLRVLGATAIRIHSPDSIMFHKSMDRELSDLDFVTYQKHEKKIVSLLGEMGYAFDRSSQFLMTISQRYILRDRVNNRSLDMFFDKLDFCHTIDFRKRLEVDYPTISLADLLLEKLQIVSIETKDLKDAIILLREHPVGDGDKEMVNAEYIAKLLANDWGFWYTFTTNLSKMQEYLPELTVLPQDDHEKIGARIRELQDHIENEPKSMGWKMRARVGTKRQWYKTVDESPQIE